MTRDGGVSFSGATCETCGTKHTIHRGFSYGAHKKGVLPEKLTCSKCGAWIGTLTRATYMMGMLAYFSKDSWAKYLRDLDTEQMKVDKAKADANLSSWEKRIRSVLEDA